MEQKELSFYILESEIAMAIRLLDEYEKELWNQGYSMRSKKIQRVLRSRAYLFELKKNLVKLPKYQVHGIWKT